MDMSSEFLILQLAANVVHGRWKMVYGTCCGIWYDELEMNLCLQVASNKGGWHSSNSMVGSSSSKGWTGLCMLTSDDGV